MLFPTQIHKTSFGILKYSTVFAKTNELGGIIQFGPFLSIKLSSEKFLGSTKELFTFVNSSLVDPKNFSDDNFVERKGPYCIIPPNSFVLAKTVEYFRIPKDVLCICVGKSTYARTGIICNVTPIENEFEGNIVIELSNTTPNPAKIYSNEGIAQFLFFKSDTKPETTYKSKNGKYQGQTTIQVAKIKK